MFSKIACLIACFVALSAQASLYTCDSNNLDGDPIAKDPLQKIPKIDYKETTAFWTTDHLAQVSSQSQKKPFLIYYAIDSDEPFMRMTVDFEVAQLQTKCRHSNYINFVALLNSKYLSDNEIIVCKNRELMYMDLSKHFPALDAKLKRKHQSIMTGNHNQDTFAGLQFPVKYREFTNGPFGLHPLAHPDFLHDLIQLVITDESLFPSHSFLPFLNLKSHGSTKYVLSGLYSCQVNAKKQTQDIIIKNKLSASELIELQRFQSINDIGEKLADYDRLMKILGLDVRAGVGGDVHLNAGETNLNIDSNLNVESNLNAGETNLNADSNLNSDSNLNADSNLGTVISGLGADEGLGADNAFGTHHTAITTVLTRLFNAKTGRKLGFVMYESCDTNRNTEFFHTNLANVMGVYSAQHSLWYRNLNWWSLLERSKNSSAELVNYLKITTPKIRNIVITH